MNTPLLRRLLGLRYRLLWAQARTRKGKVIFFLVGWLFAVLIMLLIGLGGIGAAMAAIQFGKAELVARIALGGPYLNAILAAVILGIGMNAAFSDAALRRYPLSSFERFVGRHLTAILDPLWIFILALDLGLITGFCIFGRASLWLGIPAAVLLVVTNYLLARVLSSLIERIAAMHAGSLLLATLGGVGILLVSVGPSIFGPVLNRNPGYMAAGLAVLKFTPPLAAAAVITNLPGLSSLYWMLCLLGWCFGLAVGLVALERMPISSRSEEGARASWDRPCDRLAALCGSTWAPLVSKTLRYYLRSNRVRLDYLGNILIFSFLAVMFVRDLGPRGTFFWYLGFMASVGYCGTKIMSANLFGSDGSGFRRYFLLPVAPTVVLGTASLVSLLLGGLLIPVAMLAWVIISPVLPGVREIVLLLSSGIGGLFFFNSLGVWTTLLAPSRSEFALNFYNDLSFAANLVWLGGIFGAPLTGFFLYHFFGAEALLRYWMVVPLLMLAAVAFYFLTLRVGTALLVARRERLLFILERRR
jgi:hypothetical protein